MKLKWVKTSEQLPPRPEYHRSGHYLATVDNGQVVAVDWVLVRRKNEVELPRWEWNGRICPWEVIAWMPFPRSYASECEEGREADLIEFMQDQIDALKMANDGLCISHDTISKRLTASQRREQAALEDIKAMQSDLPYGVGCYYCGHYTPAGGDGKCGEGCDFEWRGLQDVGEGVKSNE